MATISTDMWLVIGLMAFTMGMFIWERVRQDVTALLVLVCLGLFGLVPVDQLFDGFAGNAVISVIATMILGAGLDRTGLLNRVAVWLLRKSKGYEDRLVLLSSGVAGLVSSVMQNPSVTALFLPVAARLSARTGVSLGRLLLPIAVCVVMGGALTMVGSSPLILLNDLLVAANRNLPSGVASLAPLPIFAPLPIGLGLLVMALAFFWLFGARLLGQGEDKGVAPGRTESYFSRAYGIDGDVYELTVTSDSPLVGMSVLEAESMRGAPLLLALKSGNEARLAPPADEMIWVGSVLGVMGPREQVTDFAQNQLLRMQARLRNFADLFNPSRAGISEAVIPPNSQLIGQTLEQLHLRKRLGISVLAINRGNEIYREDIRNTALRAGDMLVFHSFWRDLGSAASNRDFVVVTDYPKDEQRPHKLWHALFCFALALALALSSEVAVPVALMTGVVGMLLLGVINMDEAYASVNWKTVFIMASLIPLGWAVDSSGVANFVASQTLEHFGDLPDWALLGVLGLITTGLAMVISNVGATVIMVPMAINIAISTGAAPIQFAVVVALSASNNFLTGSNPVLAMVAGPAGYRLVDLLKVGLPVSTLYIVWVLAISYLVF